MKKVLALSLFSILCLIPLYSMGMKPMPVSPVPMVPPVPVAPIVQIEETLGSYLSKALRTSLNYVKQYSTSAIDFLSKHAVPVLSTAKNTLETTLKLIKREPMSRKIVGVAALAAVAGGALYYLTHAHKEKETNNFNCALMSYVEYKTNYKKQVELIKRGLANLIPLGLGAYIFRDKRLGRISMFNAGKDAIEGSFMAFNLIHTIFDRPIEWGIRSSSYIPFFGLNLLRAQRNKMEHALHNLQKIVADQDIKEVDLDNAIRGNSLLMEDSEERAYLREMIRKQRMLHEENAVDSLQAWAGGDMPKEVWRTINSIKAHIQHEEDVKNGVKPVNPDYKHTMPAGIFLYGVAGAGKSLLAHHIGRETGCYVMDKAGAQFAAPYVGDAASNIRAAYADAQEKAKETGKPVLLFIDEADAFLADRNSGHSHGGSKSSQDEQILQILTLMDSPKNKALNVITIFASNKDKSFFDPAIQRPGRIDHWVQMGYSDDGVIFDILKEYARQYPQTKDLCVADDLKVVSALQTEAWRKYNAGEEATFFVPAHIRLIITDAVNRAQDKASDSLPKEATPREWADARDNVKVTKEFLLEVAKLVQAGLPSVKRPAAHAPTEPSATLAAVEAATTPVTPPAVPVAATGTGANPRPAQAGDIEIINAGGATHDQALRDRLAQVHVTAPTVSAAPTTPVTVPVTATSVPAVSSPAASVTAPAQSSLLPGPGLASVVVNAALGALSGSTINPTSAAATTQRIRLNIRKYGQLLEHRATHLTIVRPVQYQNLNPAAQVLPVLAGQSNNLSLLPH